jgi:hypothetical protein
VLATACINLVLVPAACSLFVKGPLSPDPAAPYTGDYTFTLTAYYKQADGSVPATTAIASITLTAAATPIVAIVTGPTGDVPNSK